MENKGTFLAGVAVMIGLICVGLSIPRAVKVLDSAKRNVSVRGLCEKEVPADKVIWPLQYSVAGDDLTALYKKIEDNNAVIKAFLKQGGIDFLRRSFHRNHTDHTEVSHAIPRPFKRAARLDPALFEAHASDILLFPEGGIHRNNPTPFVTSVNHREILLKVDSVHAFPHASVHRTRKAIFLPEACSDQGTEHIAGYPVASDTNHHRLLFIHASKYSPDSQREYRKSYF